MDGFLFSRYQLVGADFMSVRIYRVGISPTPTTHKQKNYLFSNTTA